jgi:phage gp36-like protein
MGTYATQSTLSDRITATVLIDLTNTDPTATTVNTTAMNTAIDDGEAEVHGYVGARYALPLTSPYPSLVVSLAHDCVIYRLYMLQPGFPPDDVQKRYDDAIERLKEIAAGTFSLGLKTDGTDASNSSESDRVALRKSGESRRYGRSDFKGF